MGGFGNWGGKLHAGGYTYISGSAAFGITERSRKLGRYKINTKKQKERGEAAAVSGGR